MGENALGSEVRTTSSAAYLTPTILLAFTDTFFGAFKRQVELVVKNPPANAEDERDVGSIPGSGRSPGEGNGNHSGILAWEIPWTEEPRRLQSMGLQELDMI